MNWIIYILTICTKIRQFSFLKNVLLLKKFAEEWVVPMRLEHVLQKLPEATGMEHTTLVIKAMIEDVYREGKGEIVQNKQVESAIARQTALLWKKKVMSSI